MKFTRVLAMGMASLMIFGMVGCSNNTQSSTAGSSGTSGAKKGYTIGFSNSFNGNTYRQEEEAFFKKVADKMKADGTIKEYIMVESNNNINQQISQIENLILKKVDAIIIDPGSATALNGAIEKASKAGIPCIIINDGPVTSTADKCYQINSALKEVTSTEAQYICDKLNGKGNVLVMRGQAGTESDKQLYEGMTDVFKKYPDIKIVGTVYANWTTTVAQQQVAAILPSLPKVDAVIGEGGDDYGAIQAFIAAGKEVPLVTGGNRGNFLTWWSEQNKKNGYETISSATNPWVGAAGAYVAIDILDGKNVPKTMDLPAFTIKQADLSKYANLEPTAVAAPEYDHDWVIKNLEKLDK